MAYVPTNPDPAFPDRPAHPDFALLSAISQDLDSDITGAPRYGGDPYEFARQLGIDVDSVEYLIMNKAMLYSSLTGIKAPAIGAGMLNGFVLGVEFWRLRDLAGGDANVALARLLYERGIE